MAKPNNSIAKIKLPGENTQRPIVPYGLTDGTSYATVPGMNADSLIIVSKPNDEQVIEDYPLILSKYLNIYSDDIENLDNPYNYSDPDIYIYSTKMQLVDSDGGEYYDYYFPNRSGLFVVRTGTGSGASYSESTLLAMSLEPGASETAHAEVRANPSGFQLAEATQGPGGAFIRSTYQYNLPTQGAVTSFMGNNTLGLQIDIVDLTSIS